MAECPQSSGSPDLGPTEKSAQDEWGDLFFVVPGLGEGRIADRVGGRLGGLIDRLLGRGGAPSSVWSLGWSARGFEISKILGENLPPSFPTIDRWAGGVATSIKSIDLAAPTYSNAAVLTRKLELYVNQVASFGGASFAGREIEEDEIAGRALVIAVPSSSISFDQAVALHDIEEYGADRGVAVTIKVVP